MDSLLLKFIKEAINRFFLKSPTFFKIWQKIGVALMLICGIPEAIKELNDLFQLDIWSYIPEEIRAIANRTLAAIGLTIKIMASMVVTPTNPTPVTKDGNEAAADKKLPFTQRD